MCASWSGHQGVEEPLFPEQRLLPELQDLLQNHHSCFLFEVAEKDQLSEGQQTRNRLPEQTGGSLSGWELFSLFFLHQHQRPDC